LLRDDGSSAYKLEAQKATHSKYDHMVNRSLNINPKDNLLVKIRHSLFGKTDSEIEFEKALDEFNMLNKVRTINMKKKL